MKLERMQQWQQVMRYVNNRPDTFDFELVYSTPSRYFAAVREAAAAGGQDALPLFRGDLFPASFEPHYWRTGFYSSRNAQKARQVACGVTCIRFVQACIFDQTKAAASSANTPFFCFVGAKLSGQSLAKFSHMHVR